MTMKAKKKRSGISTLRFRVRRMGGGLCIRSRGKKYPIPKQQAMGLCAGDLVKVDISGHPLWNTMRVSDRVTTETD
jgi:hypothetical protein